VVAETSECNRFAIGEKLPTALFKYSIKPSAFRLMIESSVRLAVRFRANRYDRDRGWPQLGSCMQRKDTQMKDITY
jgi:hypothetical protein